jgi:hypothetical protein
VTILWPKTEPRREDWIPLMIGMGLFDIALMFRAGLESEGRRNS